MPNPEVAKNLVGAPPFADTRPPELVRPAVGVTMDCTLTSQHNCAMSGSGGVPAGPRSLPKLSLAFVGLMRIERSRWVVVGGRRRLRETS
jgi:hypothetical protein